MKLSAVLVSSSDSTKTHTCTPYFPGPSTAAVCSAELCFFPKECCVVPASQMHPPPRTCCTITSNSLRTVFLVSCTVCCSCIFVAYLLRRLYNLFLWVPCVATKQTTSEWDCIRARGAEQVSVCYASTNILRTTTTVVRKHARRRQPGPLRVADALNTNIANLLILLGLAVSWPTMLILYRVCCLHNQSVFFLPNVSSRTPSQWSS